MKTSVILPKIRQKSRQNPLIFPQNPLSLFPVPFLHSSANDMPKISVIIPVYNGEKTIERTIQSVLHQTFTDFELLIINDGSQDRTIEIIQSMTDPRIKLYSYSNAGLAASRNRGIELATGQFLTFLDADDLWTSDKLELQLQALETHPEAGVAYSWTNYIDESDQFVRKGLHTTVNGDVLSELFIQNFLENGSNALMRRQTVEKVGYFDTSLSAAEDWDFFLRVAEDYHFVVVSHPQVLYRVSTNSMSANLVNQEKQCLIVLNRACERVGKRLQLLKSQSFANLYKYLACKALENKISRQNGVLAIRLTAKYAQYESLNLMRIKLILILWMKGILLLIFGK